MMTFEEVYADVFHKKQTPAKSRLPPTPRSATALEPMALDVRKFIVENPGTTTKDMTENLGLSGDVLRIRLRFLSRSGLLDVYKMDDGSIIYFATQRDRKKWLVENGHTKGTPNTYAKCARAGLTKAQTARAMGVSRASVTKWSRLNPSVEFRRSHHVPGETKK